MYCIKTDSNDDKNKKLVPHELLYENDNTLVSILRCIGKKYTQCPALRYKENKLSTEWTTVSYAEYLKNSEEFAERLLYNIGAHPRTAILSFNRPEWLYSHLGTMIAGGVPIGIYLSSSPEICEYIINHACVEMLVIDNFEQLAKFKNLKIPTIKMILVLDDLSKVDNFDDTQSTESDIIKSIKTNNPNLSILSYKSFMCKTIGSERIGASIEFGEISQDDTATIIYTSGTTGDPKGVILTHRNIIELLKASLHSVMTRSNIVLYMQEIFLSYLPLNHIAAQMMDIYVPLASVGTVYFADSDALKGSLKDTLKDVRPTVFIGLPRVWEKIYEKIKEKRKDPSSFTGKLFINNLIVKEIGLDRAKFCISASAPIANTIKVFFKELGIELCDVYGLSETSGPVSMGVPGCSKGVGIPLIDVKIAKDTNEILVRGGTVFKKYYKNPEATSDAFVMKKWFKTGDTGYIDRFGALYITGRIKDLIITSGGENVSPIPIEDMLTKELNKTTTLFEYVVVIGDTRRFVAVLLVPTKNYYKTNETTKLIESAIKTVNTKAPNRASTIKKFLVLEGETFEVGECLTPTIKLRRKQINQKYKKQIDHLYDSIE